MNKDEQHEALTALKVIITALAEELLEAIASISKAPMSRRDRFDEQAELATDIALAARCASAIARRAELTR